MKSNHVVTRIVTLELDDGDVYELKALIANYKRLAQDLPDGTELIKGEQVFMGQLLSALNHNVDFEDTHGT